MQPSYKLTMWGGNGKPYARELDWIESDGSAYFVIPQNIMAASAKALPVECKYIADVSIDNNCVFASYYGSRVYAIGRVTSGTPVIISRFGNAGQYSRSTDLNAVYTTKIIPSQKVVIENGTTHSADFNALNEDIDALGLFCRYNTRTKTVDNINGSRIYWFRVYALDGVTLVRDLVPVIDHARTVCLYDKVSKELIYNAGTGTFRYGEKS